MKRKVSFYITTSNKVKIYTNWKQNDIASFVMFIAKEAQRQKRKLRAYYKQSTKDKEHYSYIYHIQQGVAREAETLYNVAKDHFDFHNRKR